MFLTGTFTAKWNITNKQACYMPNGYIPLAVNIQKLNSNGLWKINEHIQTSAKTQTILLKDETLKTQESLELSYKGWP